MSIRKEAGKFLNEVVTSNCRDYIPEVSRRLIFDWYQLNEYFKGLSPEEKFYDWSFMVLPVAKAIEGILYKIAKDLKLVHGNENVGSYFSDDNIESKFSEIETSILSGEKDIKKSSEIKAKLSSLKAFLKIYRHEPLHDGKVIESFNRAEAHGKAALYTIGIIMEDLLSIGVIKNPTGEVSDIFEEAEIDLADIPF